MEGNFIKSKNDKEINMNNHYTPRHFGKCLSENNSRNSSSKKRVSDRFIPSSISKNLIHDFDVNEQKAGKENKQNNGSLFGRSSGVNLTTSSQKSVSNYQKILHSEIMEESTPSKKYRIF
jgi:hypothetical protein